MKLSYHTSVLKQLRDQQVRFAPRDKKVEQLERAEKLLSEIESERNYPYEYLWYKITDYRPESGPHAAIPGKDVLHDLRLFVEDMSDAADLKPEEVGDRFTPWKI